MKKLIIFILAMSAIITLRAEEQPPYEVKDVAISENMRQIYYDVDKLNLLVSSVTNTVLTSTSVSNSAIDGSSITKQGNTFNGISQLVKTDSLNGAISLSSGTFSYGTIGTFKTNSISYNNFTALQILQIVKANTSTELVTASTSFTDTALTVSITPKLSTSKILVFAFFYCSMDGGDLGYYTIARGTTNLAAGNNGFLTVINNNNYHSSMMAYDSPSTTSATSYTVRARVNSGSFSTRFLTNYAALGPSEGTIVAIEIAQ